VLAVEPVPTESDIDLVRRASAGDEAAFRSLFDRHAPLVFNVAYRMLGNRAEAEDLLQEVWLVVFREIGSFRGDSRFSTWVTSITANRCINRSVQMRRHAAHRDRFSREAPTEHRPPERDDERMNRILARLPDEYRMLATLRYVTGASYEEIAETLKCPVGTVKSKMHRVHEALREAYQGVEE
jgi:RNA polymerase sigma-70 factor (ECF subfamily)